MNNEELARKLAEILDPDQKTQMWENRSATFEDRQWKAPRSLDGNFAVAVIKKMKKDYSFWCEQWWNDLPDGGVEQGYEAFFQSNDLVRKRFADEDFVIAVCGAALAILEIVEKKND